MGVIHEHIVERTALVSKRAFASAVISVSSLAFGKVSN